MITKEVIIYAREIEYFVGFLMFSMLSMFEIYFRAY